MKFDKKKLGLFVLLVVIFFVVSPLRTEAGTTVKLNKTKMTMDVGNQMQLKVKNATKSVKWSTSKKSVAEVSSKGIITAKKQGTTVITAKIGKKRLTCKVTVRENPKLIQKTYLCVGKKEKLVVTGTAKKVTWNSSNKNVVKVTKNGMVTGVKKGTATITAKVGSKRLTCKVKVKAAVSSVSKPMSICNAGMVGVQFLSDQITCQSSNPKIATVFVLDTYESEEGYGKDADIIVYGHMSGTAKITITNNCNTEKVTFKVIVEKPTETTNYQKLADHILLNGQVEEGTGCKFITKQYEDFNAEVEISYDGLEDEIWYQYKETNSTANVEWLVRPTEKANTEYNIVMWIYPKGIDEEYFVTATIDAMIYNGDTLVFENAWFREAADGALQKIANDVTQHAFQCVGTLLYEETEMTWKDMGFLQL